MKNILTFLVTFCMVTSFAQTQLSKPSQLVTQQKNLGATFENLQLFKVDNKQKTSQQIPKEIKNYTIFSLDNKNFNSFMTKAPSTMELQVPGQKSSFTLELVKVDITTEEFKLVEMPSGKTVDNEKTIIHYRGIIKEQPNSIAAISFFDNEVSGIISKADESNNFVIGKLNNSKSQIIYSDNDIRHLNDFVCQMKDNPEKGYTQEQLEYDDQGKMATKCPEIFFDIANDIVNDKGGAQGASNYIEAVFNQVAVLYANDDITIKLSGVNAWTSPAPFDGLNNYRSYRNQNSFNGDLGHFVTYNFSGGVAWVNGLCSSYKYGVSGIRNSFSNVPTYSWSVEVVAHELGHNLGSQHTQACVWNGNNTAIDGCYPTEGGCPRPGIPSGGGTIMSYCHLVSAGINFNNGFGSQPSNVIKNTISGKSCVQTCDGDGGGDPCAGVSEWQSGVTYAVGDLVTYQGNLFERTASGWTNLGACPVSNDPCAGVNEWQSGTSYSEGELVTYQGNLYRRTSTGWENLGACGEANQIAALPPENDSILAEENAFVVYPNPASNIITVRMNTQAVTLSTLYVKDISGKVIKTFKLETPPGNKIEQTLDISNLASGMYFVQVINSEKTWAQKVYKK